MRRHEIINQALVLDKQEGLVDTNLISDGYHTFGELYEHRIELFIALCRILEQCTDSYIWKLSVEDGWFLMGIETKDRKQISYHIPESRWEDCNFATLRKNSEYEFDGHTSNDVLQRLKNL